jgi:hypothetical protein
MQQRPSQRVKKYPLFTDPEGLLLTCSQEPANDSTLNHEIQSIYSNPIPLRSIFMSSFHTCLRLAGDLFPSGFQTKILHLGSFPTFPMHAIRPAHLPFDLIMVIMLHEESTIPITCL